MSGFNMMDFMGFHFVMGKNKPKPRITAAKVKHRILVEKNGEEKEVTVWAESRNVAKTKVPPGAEFIRFL